MSYNQTSLIGNLTNEPELKEISPNLFICKFSIAQTDTFYSKEGDKKSVTEYFNIECWGGLAKNCKQYLSKGDKVFVTGKSSSRKFNKTNGEKATHYFINCTNIRFLSMKKSDNNNSSSEKANSPSVNHLESSDINFNASMDHSDQISINIDPDYFN
jgi:single-strand DNA-binding protein